MRHPHQYHALVKAINYVAHEVWQVNQGVIGGNDRLKGVIVALDLLWVSAAVCFLLLACIAARLLKIGRALQSSTVTVPARMTLGVLPPDDGAWATRELDGIVALP